MAAEVRNYEITVQGQYYGAHDTTGTPTVKAYVAKFILPSQEAALSVICKHLLDPYLRKHYDDYAKFRSHRITSIIVNGRAPDAKVLQMEFESMGVRDLSDFCILKHIMIDPYKHADLEKCREDVKRIYSERISQQRADMTSGAAKEKAEADELLAMNDLPKVGESPEININEQKIGAALKREKKLIDTDVPPEEGPIQPVDEGDLLG